MNQVIHDSNNSTIAGCHPEPFRASEPLCYIGLGSNLGDRAKQIAYALNLLDTHPQVKVICSSSNYENPAIEDAGPYDFLNAVAQIETNLEALDLLDLILETELKIDPERNERGRKSARKIDIDLLTYGDLELNHERLILPHPRMHEREFVMKPLASLKEDPTVIQRSAAT